VSSSPQPSSVLLGVGIGLIGAALRRRHAGTVSDLAVPDAAYHSRSYLECNGINDDTAKYPLR
jgi:hypothetical protein